MKYGHRMLPRFASFKEVSGEYHVAKWELAAKRTPEPAGHHWEPCVHP